MPMLPTNNLGNLFIAINPTRIMASSYGYVAYNAAGATAETLGAQTQFAGPWFPIAANISQFRLTGMSVQVVNIMPPLERSGTLTVARTARARGITGSPDFANILMAPIAREVTGSADEAFIVYMPDSEIEWGFLTPLDTIETDSDIILSVQGARVSSVCYKVIISGTMEFIPTAVSRPIITLKRAPVTPATVSAFQLVSKQYTSLLLESPMQRGELMRRLLNAGPTVSLSTLSEYLIGQPLRQMSMAYSTPSTHSTGGGTAYMGLRSITYRSAITCILDRGYNIGYVVTRDFNRSMIDSPAGKWTITGADVIAVTVQPNLEFILPFDEMVKTWLKQVAAGGVGYTTTFSEIEGAYVFTLADHRGESIIAYDPEDSDSLAEC